MSSTARTSASSAPRLGLRGLGLMCKGDAERGLGGDDVLQHAEWQVADPDATDLFQRHEPEDHELLVDHGADPLWRLELPRSRAR